jgi:hypothetical protein
MRGRRSGFRSRVRRGISFKSRALYTTTKARKATSQKQHKARNNQKRRKSQTGEEEEKGQMACTRAIDEIQNTEQSSKTSKE